MFVYYMYVSLVRYDNIFHQGKKNRNNPNVYLFNPIMNVAADYSTPEARMMSSVHNRHVCVHVRHLAVDHHQQYDDTCGYWVVLM